MTTPDAFMLATDGVPDALVRLLRNQGLDIPGSFRLAALSGYWSSAKTPQFLKDGPNDEMCERLGMLNVATYRKLGQAKYFLSKTKEAFGKVYPHQFGQNVAAKENLAAIVRWCSLDEIERQAVFDAFTTSLVSALDSLACEACLVLGLKDSIWFMQFSTLEEEMRSSRSASRTSVRDSYLQRLADTVLDKHVDMAGEQAGWLDQLRQCRHLAAHRPSRMWYANAQVAEDSVLWEYHLAIDPVALPSSVMPGPSATGVSQTGASRIVDEFLPCTVQEYCAWAFDKVVNLTSDAYNVLAHVYSERSNNPSALVNDKSVLRRRSSHHRRTQFRGIQ
jgi:hypothetical protein